MSRQLTKNKIELELITCNLCQSNRYKQRYQKPDDWLRNSLFQYPVVECLDCGLVFVNPRPTKTSMKQFYVEEYYEDRDTEKALKRYQNQSRWLGDLNDLSVLDVGCAHGDFLQFLLNRYPTMRAFGVDAYSERPVDERIRFAPTPPEACPFPDASFDLIMAWAVMEHLSEPRSSFEKLARLLKPKGRFVFLCTNADSLYGTRAYLEDLPRHLFHFSEKTLAKFADKCGLRIDFVTYDDSCFDGRGFGTFRYLLGGFLGWDWEKELLNQKNLFQKIGLYMGSLIDRVVFRWHWEAKLRRSGVIVVQMTRP